MELRDIEIFLALAEELHFGRTAERLHVSQARVSQAIKKQERRIGGALFERTSRNVTLTPLGAQLRDDLRAGYDTINAGLARATGSARGVIGTLRLGVMGNDSHLLLEVIERFLTCNPGCDIEVPELHFSNAHAALRTDQADIVPLWRPIREPDLTDGPVVFTVGRVLAVSTGHELARRASVSMEDLADHVVINLPPLPDYWLDAMLPRSTPSGRPIARHGPLVYTFHEVLTLVAAGQCVTPVGEQARLYAAHPGVVFVPIHDAALLDWSLVWRTVTETPLIRAFAQAARDIGPSTLEGLTTTSSEGRQSPESVET